MSSLRTASARRPARCFMLLGSIEAGLAGVFRLVEHSGAEIAEQGSRCRITFDGTATLTWFAWYSARIVNNGWEPYDQPHPSAYAPLSYLSFNRYPISNGGVLLRQTGLEHTSRLVALRSDLQLIDGSPFDIATRVRDLLDGFGVPLENADPIRFLVSAGAELSSLHPG